MNEIIELALEEVELLPAPEVMDDTEFQPLEN